MKNNLKCGLNISHANIRDSFKDKFIRCPALSRAEVGMKSAGVICAGCCLRISHLLEAKKDLLLRHLINVEDYRRNPDVIKEHLPDHLLVYYEAIRKLGLKLEDVEFQCKHCHEQVIGQEVIYRSEASEITYCSKEDFYGVSS